MAAGIKTGGLTGRGANLMIVDDPIKNVEGAMSETYRQKVWDWFVSTARSRLEPGGVMIVIMTRWHEDDLVGRILKGTFQTGWERVRLPALAEENDPIGRPVGTPLWPWRMNLAELNDIASTSDYWWNAMYQQHPRPPGGALAKQHWFKPVAAVNQQASTKVRFWDIASTEGSRRADPDWTVGALVSRNDADKTFTIEHIVRVRYSPADVNALILGVAKQDGRQVAIREEQEPGASGKSVIAARMQMLAGWNYNGVPSTGAKETRWMPFLVQAEAGYMRILDPGAVHGTGSLPWVKVFMDEALSAPYGTHDDQMDAVSGAFNTLTLHQTSAIPGLVW
jgi:predicted phage terminase large subunit-like protein